MHDALPKIRKTSNSIAMPVPLLGTQDRPASRTFGPLRGETAGAGDAGRIANDSEDFQLHRYAGAATWDTRPSASRTFGPLRGRQLARGTQDALPKIRKTSNSIAMPVLLLGTQDRPAKPDFWTAARETAGAGDAGRIAKDSEDFPTPSLCRCRYLGHKTVRLRRTFGPLRGRPLARGTRETVSRPW